MMASYSQALRDRVLVAVKAGKKSQAELAENFGVILSTAEKWWHRWRTMGQSTPQLYRAGPPRTLAECDLWWLLRSSAGVSVRLLGYYVVVKARSPADFGGD